jgi:hypothetical protein
VCNNEAAGTSASDGASESFDDDAFTLEELQGVFAIFGGAVVLAVLVDYADKDSREALQKFEENEAEKMEVHRFTVQKVRRASSFGDPGARGRKGSFLAQQAAAVSEAMAVVSTGKAAGGGFQERL